MCYDPPMSKHDLSSTSGHGPSWDLSRRALLKSGTAAVAGLGAAPSALASIAPPKWPASGGVVLQFNVTPAPARP